VWVLAVQEQAPTRITALEQRKSGQNNCTRNPARFFLRVMSYQIASRNSFVYSESESEGVGFEPTDRLLDRLISSQVHSTTLPPFRLIESGKIVRKRRLATWNGAVSGRDGFEAGKCDARPGGAHLFRPLPAEINRSPDPPGNEAGKVNAKSKSDEARCLQGACAALIARVLIYLLSFRVTFTLTQVFVVVGQTIHEQPEKPDETGAHRVKPLRGVHKKYGRAEETGGTDHADDGVEPSDDGLEIERKRCG
jgi:hypothetical protein